MILESDLLRSPSEVVDVLRNLEWDGLESSSVQPMDAACPPGNRADLTGLILEDRTDAERRQAVGRGVRCESASGDFHRAGTLAG